jgi:5-methylcytosine-specific restriction endonuclease McrA
MYPDSTTKRCTKCGEIKPLNAFNLDKRLRDGLQSDCKACEKDYRQARARTLTVTEARCPSCSLTLPASAFAKSRAAPNGLQTTCRACIALRNPVRRERMRQRKIDDPEVVIEQARKSRQRNHASIRAHINEWRDRNRDKTNRYENARRARKLNAPGSHTVAEWEALKAHYDYRCLCCGKQEPEIKLTEDHVIPLGPDGSDGIENIQPLCGPCNSSKGARHTTDYR